MPIALQPATSFTTTITDNASTNRTVTLPNDNGTLASIIPSTSFSTSFTSAHTANRSIALPDRNCTLTDGLQRGTVVGASGTSVTFSIPSYVKKITMVFNSMSTTGTSYPIIRIGSSSSLATTGYTGYSSYVSEINTQGVITFTNGFRFYDGGQASEVFHGVFKCYNINLNQWQAEYTWAAIQSNRLVGNGVGFVTLPTTLNIIGITTVGGTDTFDAGSVNVFYE